MNKDSSEVQKLQF